ncbi:hypothetical protein EBR21_14755, partial [bacterium]|nr:hypothetical protein [bacterium]
PIELNLLNLPTLLTPTRDINVQVSGKNLSSYSFAVVAGDSCKDATYSEARTPDQPIAESLQSGIYTLCVKGASATGVETAVKSFSWTIDSNIPGTVLIGIPTDVNISPYLTATVMGTNAETYRYKVVPGYRTGEQCGQDEYSIDYKIDRPIEHKMTNDGEQTICLLGTSRTGVVQSYPTPINFFQNASAPSVSVTLSGGEQLPSVSNGSPLNLTLYSLNLASEFSYTLADTTLCPAADATQFSSRTPFGSSNQKDITLNSQDLQANISTTTKRGTKTLCIMTTKTVKTGVVRSSVRSFQFIVDLNSIVISETNVSGLPVNPNIASGYRVRIIPPDATTTNFNVSTSFLYYKVEKIASQSVGECSFTGVSAITFRDTIDIADINQEGWWRFCLLLENSAKSKSNVVGVMWYKSAITASAPTSSANTTATIKLAQASKTTSLSQTISVASANPGMNSTYAFKYKYFIGSKPCADDVGTYSSPFASTLKLNINPLAKATGIHTICLLGIEKNEQGEVVAEQKEPMRYEWFHDETVPTVTVSNAPAIASNRLTDVTIKFTA